MKRLTLNYTCTLNASPEAVFAFHTDVVNLPRITPPWIRVRLLEHKGAHVVLAITQHLVTTRWVIDIAMDSHQRTITDTLRQGPLRHFVHTRHFLPLEGGGTCMEERVEIDVGFGFVGALLHPLIRRDMDTMFAYRHRATKEALEGNSSTRSPQ